MSNWLHSAKSFLAGLSPTYIVRSSEDGGSIDAHVIAHQDKNSFIAEQYKLICRKLFFLSKERDRLFRTLMLTSCQPREGKTTTACNLAITLSLGYQKKVALIDADMRRSSVHRMFGVPRKPGLIELTTGRCSLDEILKQPQVDGVQVVAAGSQANIEPGEILQSAEFLSVLEALKERFDYVIFDAPPVLKVSDPAILGQFCDAVLFIIKAGATPREVITEGFDTLERTGTPATASILVGTPSFPDYYSYLTKRSYRDYYRNRYTEYGEGKLELDASS